MGRTKVAMRLVLFALLVAIMCVNADLSFLEPAEMLPGIVHVHDPNPRSGLSAHQPHRVLMDAYDHTYMLRISPTESKEIFLRRSNPPLTRTTGCVPPMSFPGSLTARRHSPSLTTGKGHLSVLALSLGGNSPPA